MHTNCCQRWTPEGRSVYVPVRPFFNPREFEVAEIDEARAKQFILQFHYSGSYPASRRRYGLFRRSELVGAAVYSHPVSDRSITKVFNCEKGSDGIELGRLVLKEEILSNAESFFVAECHRRLKKEGFAGVISFSDDVPRTALDGSLIHPGHHGIVYQALNSAFLGRGSAVTLNLLPDGKVLSKRAISKIRAGETGWQYAAQQLEKHGAPPCPGDPMERRLWLVRQLRLLTRRINHPGNLKYAWSFSKKLHLKTLPYPKAYFDPTLF